MPTRVSWRVRIHHIIWWPFLAYPDDLGKWQWTMSAYQNTLINLHPNVRRVKFWMRRMKAAFASLSAPRLLLDQLAVGDVHIFVLSNVKTIYHLLQGHRRQMERVKGSARWDTMVLRRHVVLSAMHREFDFIFLLGFFSSILIVGDLDSTLMTAKMTVLR